MDKIIFQNGIANQQISVTLKKYTASFSKIIFLCDTNTERDCLPLLDIEVFLNSEKIFISAGETHKNIQTCQHIWSELLRLRADRNTVLVNVGGGVVSDMGGFAAATYKRGIAFINVPTSLLAMVDASVGGKTGIDFGGIKNSIGVFKTPEAVLIDTIFLQTLSPRELQSGYAEMIKHHLISGIPLPELGKLTYIDIERSVAVKSAIVAADPTEQGLRQVLNFGHTVGHAIEAYCLYTDLALLHGEAVALGMAVEAAISSDLYGWDFDLFYNQYKFLLIYNYKYINQKYFTLPLPEVWELMQNDKKNTENTVKMVALRKIGDPVYGISITLQQIENAYKRVLLGYNKR